MRESRGDDERNKGGCEGELEYDEAKMLGMEKSETICGQYTSKRCTLKFEFFNTSSYVNAASAMYSVVLFQQD